jgi:hypothetical protein
MLTEDRPNYNSTIGLILTKQGKNRTPAIQCRGITSPLRS